MKTYSFENVNLTSGYLFDKQVLNRKVTIPSVYDRFTETGRFKVFDFDYKEGDELVPHIFWDSDVAKWCEGVAYVLAKHCEPELEAKVDAVVEQIKAHQCEDGYFNVYFTVVKPEERWTNRDRHELYCAGHLIEAAVAYSKATGKNDFLTCMEKYVDYIYKVFVEENSADFRTPGHQEIELALVKLYAHTGKEKYLKLAEHFLNLRGVVEEQRAYAYNQSHLPVREQDEAVGHSVRALYMYTGMATVAAQNGDQTLVDACYKLWENVTKKKMYVTGGVGSFYGDECFTSAYDLPNETAYTETCAAIALIFFGQAMLTFDHNRKYGDTLERVLYNGVLSGLSNNGKAFFYENPLEINLDARFISSRFSAAQKDKRHYSRRLPITIRQECFNVSCCPPNVSRLLATLGNYVYGQDGDTLYVNQYVASTLDDGAVRCEMTTAYPNDGAIRVCADGVKFVALRIPAWCDNFTLNKAYRMEKGYAIVENDGTEILLDLDMTPKAVWSNSHVWENAGKLCIMRGPIVYCAEGVDNGSDLHSFIVPTNFTYRESLDETFGLCNLEIDCFKRVPFEDALYANQAPKVESATLKLIPYNAFANRGESDMRVWFCAQ